MTSASRPLFDDADMDFVRSLAPHLAEGARRGLLIGEATNPEGPEAPGQLALARVLSRAGRWIVLHGATLQAGESRQVAVIVEPPIQLASRPC